MLPYLWGIKISKKNDYGYRSYQVYPMGDGEIHMWVHDTLEGRLMKVEFGYHVI